MSAHSRGLRNIPNALNRSLRTSRSHSQVKLPPARAFLSQHVPRQRSSATAQSIRAAAWQLQTRRYASTETADKKTPLYDLHVEHGGKMVPFGGFLMPVQYSDLSIVESHHWTRDKASLFDVSHMLQHTFSGPGAADFLSRVSPTSVHALKPHTSSLSCLLHGTGGVVDDCIITRIDEQSFYVVTNAGCRDKDCKYLKEQIEQWTSSGDNQSVEWTTHDDWGLVALQGPKAAEILSSLVQDKSHDIQSLLFGQSAYLQLQLSDGAVSERILVSRGGYTGEDGFELSVPSQSETIALTRHLLASNADTLRLAGLGARDSLRLEAGMCLYGHELDDTITPVEAGLSWIIGKDRREAGGFHGSSTILSQLKPKKEGGSGVTRRRIGLIVEGAPARQGADIVDKEGQKVGEVTSGCPSPTLKKNIAMGYVKSGLNKAGTELGAVVRGKTRKAVVVKMPFAPSKYWKGPGA